MFKRTKGLTCRSKLPKMLHNHLINVTIYELDHKDFELKKKNFQMLIAITRE